MKKTISFLLTAVFLFTACRCPGTADSVSVPILMYHDFTDEAAADGSYTVTLSRFSEHLTALETAGYRSVTFADLIGYVQNGTPLPQKPVLLTADDGYTGVAAIAAPEAAVHGMTISCAVIGSLAGTDGHFSAAAVPDNVEIVSHTFALHDRPGWTGVLPNAPLPFAERLLAEDCRIMRDCFGERFPYTASVLVYPHGRHSPEAERLLHSLGYTVTVTCEPGTALLHRGCPESLYALPRIFVRQETTAGELLRLMRSSAEE